MRNTRKKIFAYLILLCVLFINWQSIFANQTFQNNLLKADLRKSAIGGVKLTLYTKKPYNDSVVANKKNDFEYVILMPETSNSLTVKPSVISVSDVVKSVDIKTQQYENKLKGYTKITILTSKPIEIMPEVKTMATSLSENDYKELLAQASKKQITPVKKEVKPIEAKKELTKPVPKAQTKTSISKITTPVLAQKTVKKLTSAKSIKEKPVYKVPVAQPKRAEIPKSLAPAKPIETKIPIVQKKVTKEEIIPAQPAKTTLETKVSPEVKTTEVKTTEVKSPEVKEISAPIKYSGKFKKYKRIIKNNIYTICGGLFAAGLLLLLFIIKRNAKNFHKQKETFTSQLKEQPLPVTDYTENISEEMDWKEKFQTYVDTKQAQESASSDSEELETNIQENPELDGLFINEYPTENIPEEVTVEDISYQEVKEEGPQEEFEPDYFIENELTEEGEFPENYILPSEEISEEKIDEIFQEDENYPVFEESQPVTYSEEFPYEQPENIEDLVQEEYLQEVEQPEEQKQEGEVIKSEFAIDDEKGFYLVDFENTTALVGHIGEEFFVLKRFDNIIDGQIQARLNERKENVSSYMTKVGSFKALIEVAPDNMNLLIEL